jgi:hypothetical protein
MGQIFSQLTQPNSALVNPNGSVAAMGDPSKMRDMDFKASSQQHPYLPGTPNPNAPVATAQTPSFQQAASYGATPGGGNALSPGLTKAGKLVTLLQSGLQGALAGRAKSEETVAATGGRRSGGAGMGFEAGYELPWQREQKQLGLQQQEAQVGATKAQSQLIQTPNGPIPAWLAKTVLPAQIKGAAETGAAQIGATSRENVAGTQQQTQQQIHRYIPVPGVGLFDTQTRQAIPETEQGITITPEIAKDHNLPDSFIGKPMSLQQLAAVQRSDVFQNAPMMTAQGPVVVNRKTSTATPVTGPGGQQYSPPALASPREVADVNNPGQTITMSGGQAIGQPGVQSASVQVPKKAAEAEVPTQIGNQKVAFTTAIQHADLLGQVATALKNGDVRTLAGLKNRFKTEFGATNLNDFNVVANAYNNEINKILGGGNATIEDLKTSGATLPSNANIDTLMSAIGNYKKLAQSKMNMLDKQKQNAINQSQPNKPNTPKPTSKFVQAKPGVMVEQ